MNFSGTGRLPNSILTGLLAICLSAQDKVWGIMEHEAEELTLNDKLTLSSLLDLSLERHPHAGVLKARAATIDAQQKYASRWLPDATQLAGYHVSDQALDDTGMYENEILLSFPVWLPGEKKAQTRLGEVLSDSRDSGEAEFRWRVSGQLRQLLWAVKLASEQWQLAAENEQYMDETLAQANLFAESGELSRAELLATMEEVATSKGEILLLEAEYMDALRAYHSFTGMKSIPVQIDESLSEKVEIGQDHPALRQAMDRMTEASAATEVVRQGTNERPNIGVFYRDSRSDAKMPEVDALGIGFAMPIGKSPRRDPEVAKAYEAYAAAEARMHETKRLLDLQLHEAGHVVHTVRERLENSEFIMEAASERHRLDQLAYEVGDLSIREWLGRLFRFKKIEQSHKLLELQQGAAIAAYNQAVGESL